jgi:transcription elongation regulator 1
MLKEEDKLTEKSQWRKVKGWFQKDPRYKAIESSSRKEELFNEYIKSLNRVKEIITNLLHLACKDIHTIHS